MYARTHTNDTHVLFSQHIYITDYEYAVGIGKGGSNWKKSSRKLPVASNLKFYIKFPAFDVFKDLENEGFSGATDMEDIYSPPKVKHFPIYLNI